jgi:hypothetical protein
MSFDPNKFLAKTENMAANKAQVGGFDPDAFLAKTAPAAQQEKKSPGLLKRGEAFIESLGKEASFGYLPEMQAAVEPYAFRALSALTGKDVESEGTLEERKKGYVQRSKRLREEAPVASAAGLLTGAVATPIPGFGAGAGIGKAMGRAALSGAISAGAYNPYAESEEIGVGLKERGEMAAKGGLIGGLFGGVIPGAKALGRGLKEGSDELAIRALGPYKREITKLYNRGTADDLAKFVKNKFSLTGATPESLFDDSSRMINKTGKEIGEIYQGVQQKLDDPKFLESIGPQKAEKLVALKDQGINIAVDLLEDVESSFAKKPGGANAVSFIEKTVAAPLSEIGDDVPSLLKFRGQVDDLINWSRRTQDMPVNQEALVMARRKIQNSINKRIEALDDIVGGKQMERLKELNKDYGLASTVKEITANRVNAKKANMMFGLPELLVGGSYGAYSEGLTPEGLAKGLLAAGGLKLGRTYGPALGARALGSPGRLLEKSAAGAQGLLSPERVGRIVGPRRNQDDEE